MAVVLNKVDTPAKLTTALNALVPSGHPGQDTQLTRAVSTAIGEINAFASAAKLLLIFEIHRDNKVSRMYINVQPVSTTNAGEIEAPPST